MSKFPDPFESEVDFHLYLAGRYRNKRKNAFERGIEFTLTLQDLIRIYKRRTCYLTGKQLVFGNENEQHHCYATLDRVDPSKGYTIENTKLVSRIANMTKCVFEQKEQLITLKDLCKMGCVISKHIK